jgi:hypothetical protein
MFDIKEAYKWGEEVKELIRKRQEQERAVQKITYGGKTIECKKGKVINFMDFFK